MSYTITDDSEIDDEYQPVYEFDPDAGINYGEVVDRVPEEAQIEALKTIEGEGPVEPDGWFEGYGGGALPVVDGVPITMIEHAKRIGGKREGAESSSRYAVDSDLGVVEIHKAFAHPGNTSKIKVNKPSSEDDDR